MLLLEERMLDDLCLFTPRPVLVLDAAGKALHLNEAFRVYWDVDPSRLLGPDGYQVLDDPILGCGEAGSLMARALRGVPARLEALNYSLPEQYCLSAPRPEGLRRLALTALPLPPGNDGAALALLFDETNGNGHAPTQRRCARLAAINRSVLDLQHEINNPLLLIIGNTQLLMAKGDKFSPDVLRKLEKVLGAAEKIRTIVQEHRALTAPLESDDQPLAHP
ncbi:MAG: hypothetical protein C4524_13565 [Candidatus Zixiibacteriota bacterium]|nr:MAG: hypothetical protein C4524_13565 [candidate division Zixibacteria bacterium]